MKRITIIYDNSRIIEMNAMDAWIEKCDNEFQLHYNINLEGQIIRLPLTKYMKKIFIDDIK